MAYFFASPVDVDIKLEGEESRKQVETKTDKEKTVSCPVYYDGDSVSGQVRPPTMISSGPYILTEKWSGNNTRARWQEDEPRRYQS